MITKDSPQLMTIVANVMTRGKPVQYLPNIWKLNGWRVRIGVKNESNFLYSDTWPLIALIGPERKVEGEKYGISSEYIDLSNNKAIKSLLRVIGII